MIEVSKPLYVGEEVFILAPGLSRGFIQEGVVLKPKTARKSAASKPAPVAIVAEAPLNAYESIFIVKPNLSEEEINGVVEKAKTIIADHEGEVASCDNWGKKKLAYEVQKERKGIYINLHFKGRGKAVAELERFYRFSEAVIKYMTIKIDPEALGKSAPIREEKTFVYRGRGGRGWR